METAQCIDGFRDVSSTNHFGHSLYLISMDECRRAKKKKYVCLWSPDRPYQFLHGIRITIFVV
jgi:hypothetical protein